MDGGCDCPAGFSGNLCQFDDGLCADVDCQNGGTCLNGACNCPTGFGGSLCQNEPTPVSIRWTRIRLLEFPTGAYDVGSGPDLILCASDTLGGTTCSPAPIMDAVSASAYTLDPGGAPVLYPGVSGSMVSLTLLDEDPGGVRETMNNWSLSDPADFDGDPSSRIFVFDGFRDEVDFSYTF